MDYQYIKENTNKTPINRNDFINQLEKMCNALDVEFIEENKYKNVSNVLLDIFAAMLKFQREYSNQ